MCQLRGKSSLQRERERGCREEERKMERDRRGEKKCGEREIDRVQ